MTQEDVVYRFRLRTMALAEEIGNVRAACRMMGIHPSTYYRWPKKVERFGLEILRPRERRKPRMPNATPQVLEHRVLAFALAHQGFGPKRIAAGLRARGHRVGLNRVARLMRAAGLRGVSRRRTVTTTRREVRDLPAPDLVDREFEAAGPDRLWVADITYVPTTAGFFYLSVVLDAWSCRVVVWPMATDLKSKLVLDALDMALHRRRPEGVIHHSDQGTSIAFGQRCREADVRPSMGSIGDAYDNALCERFFASLECELIDRITLRSFTHGRREVFDYIEGWYNPHRGHSALGYKSPINYERSRPKAA